MPHAGIEYPARCLDNCTFVQTRISTCTIRPLRCCSSLVTASDYEPLDARVAFYYKSSPLFQPREELGEGVLRTHQQRPWRQPSALRVPVDYVDWVIRSHAGGADFKVGAALPEGVYFAPPTPCWRSQLLICHGCRGSQTHPPLHAPKYKSLPARSLVMAGSEYPCPTTGGDGADIAGLAPARFPVNIKVGSVESGFNCGFP